MTFLRTLGFTIVIAILFGFLASKPLLDVTLLTTFILFVLIGTLLHYFFREEDINETITLTSMIYLPASVMAIIFGFATNLLIRIFEVTARQAGAASGIGTLAVIFTRQNVTLTLLALLIGLFGPICILRWKEFQTAFKQIMWNVSSILIIYVLSWLVNILIMKRLFGGQIT